MTEFKTVFEEPIEVGDKIMYIYKSQGIMSICFGEVLSVEYKKHKYMTRKQPRLHVQKKYEIRDGRRRQPTDIKVILTNPIAFKCGQDLPYPSDDHDGP